MTKTEALRLYGCDTEGALQRFSGNLAVYEQWVEKSLTDKHIGLLLSAAENSDSKAVFENAHTLKGIYLTMGFTPLIESVNCLAENARRGILGKEFFSALVCLTERISEMQRLWEKS